jgi:DNA-binding Lrp family transcriptional regulator
MQASSYDVDTDRFAKCIEVSKRVRWDIDKDVLRGRKFDFSQKFLPDRISKVNQLEFLSKDEKKFLSQVQGRTYANMFGFVERFITAKILELTRDYWMGDQIALESMVRFSDEELKHQELFRRVEKMMADGMPEGYTFLPDPNEVAAAVLEKSSWAVMALTFEIELFTQAHYKESIEPDENLSELYKDLFLFHWKEETTHAMMDEIEWPRLDKKIAAAERDRAVDEVIELVSDVDGILQAQRKADVEYFTKVCSGSFSKDEIEHIEAVVLQAYRWQYIFSGVGHLRFQKLLKELTTQDQRKRLNEALESIK